MKPTASLPLLRLLSAAFLAAASTACSGVNNNAAPAPVAAPLAAAAPAAGSLMQQITAEIGAAACDAPAQCKTLAIGAKACGGPESHVAYSTKQSDGAKLTALAARHAEARKKADARSGMMSTCSVVSDPGATCDAGRCVTLQRTTGSSNVR